MNPVGTLSGWLGQQTPGVPGAGGYNQAEGDPSVNPNLQPVPGGPPGTYIDTATGQVVNVDQNGNPTVQQGANPNQLTTQDQASMLAQQQAQAGALAKLGQTISGENGAIQDYSNTITNPNAPSVARSQLETGLNAINGQQLAIANSATGNNQPAAMRTAAQDIAGNQIAANGQQALLRANEVATAEAGKAGLLTAQGNQLGQLYGTAGSEAVGYTGNATQNQGNVLTANTSNNQFNAKQNANLIGGLGSGITSLASMA